MRALKHYMIAAGLALPFLFLTSDGVAAQGRSGRGGGGNDGGGALIRVHGRDQLLRGRSRTDPGILLIPPQPRDRSIASGYSKEPGER